MGKSQPNAAWRDELDAVVQRERGELRRDANLEIADLLTGAPFIRLLPLGLPPITPHCAEELLETVWRGIAPSAVDDRRA